MKQHINNIKTAQTNRQTWTTENCTVPNSRFAKAGVSCFYDSEVLNSSFVHLMKFSAEKPPTGARMQHS